MIGLDWVGQEIPDQLMAGDAHGIHMTLLLWPELIRS
jgi:hypothetical protein